MNQKYHIMLVLTIFNMSVCKSCGKRANSLNFCPECGTSIHIVSDKQYEIFIKERESRANYNTFRIAKKKKASTKKLSKSSTDTKKFVCEICSSKFSEKRYLIEHKKREHNDPSAKAIVIVNTVDIEKIWSDFKFVCEFCSFKFRTKADLKEHKKAAHKDSSANVEVDDKKFICEICSCRFQKELSLIKHEIRAHPYSDISEFRSFYMSKKTDSETLK